MTTPEPQSPAPEPARSSGPSEPEGGSRVHRSAPGIVGGVLLLVVAGWLGGDALVAGEGRTPWLALAALLLVVPLVVAFTLRPAVRTDADRLHVRNPFRVIVLPWGRVAALRSGYSHEVLTDTGAKYQLWALPVSLRERKRAARQEARAMGERAQGIGTPAAGRRTGGGGASRPGGSSSAAPGKPVRARTDRIMDELRELREDRQGAKSAQGPVSVRWAYEILAPAAAGAVLLVVLLATG